MTRLTRRQFLAFGAAGAAIASLPALAGATDKPWNSRVSRPIRKYSESLATACGACASHCSLIAYRQDKRVAAVIPEAGGCPRGLATLEALYDGERLTAPLRRVGRRGAGQWERMTWEEAATAVASALRDAGQNSVADLGRADPLAASLLPTLGLGTVATCEATRNWVSRKARKELYGSADAVADLSNARTVILWGANDLDGGADFARSVSELVKAKKSGATIVLVSSRAGSTGSFADRWIPVKPGFEAHAALALASALIGVIDEAKLKERFGVDPAEVKELAAKAAASCGDRLAGLASEDAKYLTSRFAKGGVAVRCDGAGLANSSALEAATAMLNALGGTVRLRANPLTGLEVAATASAEKVGAQLAGGKRVGVYLAYRANPAFALAQNDGVAKALADESRVGLVVSFDTHLTETGRYADILLPAASDLECWNLFSGLCPNGVPGYLLSRPVQVWGGETEMLKGKDTPLAMLFDGPKEGAAAESRQLGDFLLLVAKHAGKATPAKSSAEAVADGAAKLGFKPGHSWMPAELAPVELKGDGDVLKALILSARKPATAGGGLALVAFDHTELDPVYPNSAFAREIRPENPVFLNAATAQKLGLARGEKVVVKSSAGSVEGSLFPVQTLHPDSVGVARDFGHTASGSAASSKTPAELAPKVLSTRKDFLKTAVGEVRATLKAEGHGGHEGGSGPGVNAAALPALGNDGEGVALWRETPVTVMKG